MTKDLSENTAAPYGEYINLYMRKFFLTFPKCETLSHKLSWSHYFEILKADDKLEIVSPAVTQFQMENINKRQKNSFTNCNQLE